MKKLIIFVLLSFAMKAQAQLQKDKVYHFCAGAAISGAFSGVTAHYTGRPGLSILAGFTAGALAGIGKEVYDKQTGNGTPSTADALWTIAGAAVGSVSVTLVIKERKQPEGVKL